MYYIYSVYSFRVFYKRLCNIVGGPTVCVTGAGADGGIPSERKKVEA